MKRTNNTSNNIEETNNANDPTLSALDRQLQQSNNRRFNRNNLSDNQGKITYKIEIIEIIDIIEIIETIEIIEIIKMNL